MGQIECKLCSPGTYVSWERHPGTSATDCKACPYGRIRRRNPLLGSLSNQHDENIKKTLAHCTVQKHTYSKVQKLPSQLRFSLPSIIITITSKEPWNKETHRTDRNPPVTNHKPWPFELLFPKRSAKMIDDGEKRQRQLAIELQNSRVFEKRSSAQNNNSARASN